MVLLANTQIVTMKMALRNQMIWKFRWNHHQLHGHVSRIQFPFKIFSFCCAFSLIFHSFINLNRKITKIIHFPLSLSLIFREYLAGFGYRHLQIVLLFFGLFMAYALRVNISVGIVAMIKSSDNNQSTHDVSHKQNTNSIFILHFIVVISSNHFPHFLIHSQTYVWDKSQQGLILSSFFWGYLLAQVPVSHLAQRCGAKILLTFASIMCALLTVITPWAASIDWKMMLLTRAFQGLFQGFYYPCVHTLLSKWVHPSERGTLTTFTYSGTQAGSVVMLGISGILAKSSIGWPGIFYVSGGFTLVWTLCWAIFGASSPAVCSRISIEERKFIETMPGSSHTRLRTPWPSILCSVPVIALVIVHSTQCWGFWTLLTETPSFLQQIFHFDIKTVCIGIEERERFIIFFHLLWNVRI